MIPPLGPEGHLPLGRYPCTVEELRSAFVDDESFEGSSTRLPLFRQFVRYLAAWEEAEDAAGCGIVLKHLWVAGSFASAKLDPDDIDVSPVIDGVVFDSLAGRPGTGKIRRLFEQRDRVVREFGIEPFKIVWRPVVSLDDTRVTPLQRDYQIARGRYDDLWQRVSSQIEKGPFTVEDCPPRRGYLEVER